MRKLVLIGVLIAVVAVMGVWWRQSRGVTQNEHTSVMATSTNTVLLSQDLETYVNKTFGYQVNYPKGIELHTYPTTDDRLVGFSIEKYLGMPIGDQYTKELERVRQVVHFGTGISISIDNPITPDEYSSPCDWYYRERENDDVSSDPTICAGKTKQKYYAGYPTTFAGEPSYVRIKDSDGIDGGLYANKQYTIVFFHRGRPWEIQYSAPPDNPTDAWKHHPYYQYLAKSVPITDAIIKSFRFTQ